MVLLELFLSAELDGVDTWTRNQDTPWLFKAKCSNCQESTNVIVDLSDLQQIPNSRGEAHTVQKCRLCERVFTIKILPSLFEYTQSMSGEFISVAVFECRGVELLEWIFHPTVAEFVATAGNNNGSGRFLFSLDDQGEWYDVGESLPIQITDTQHHLKKMK